MTNKPPLPPAILRTAVLAASLCAASAGSAAPDPAAADVLDLRQTAGLLRVPPGIVVKLAQSGSLPARRIGSEWRFNRVALMEWLQGDRYAYPSVPRKAAEIQAKLGPPGKPQAVIEEAPAEALGSGLTIAELSGIRGAGRAEALQLAQASALPEPRPADPGRPIGERPTGPTAEETALREQGIALLQGGAKTVELGLSYARQVRDLQLLGRDEANLTTATLTGRYGLRDDLQITVRQSYHYRRDSGVQVQSVDPLSFSRTRRTDHYAGDLSISLAGVALRENVGRPSVLWTADAVLPTGPGDAGLGGGLVVAKSYDPVVVFAGANYLYGSRIDAADPRRSLAKHNWGFNLGYAYAVNDSLALSGQFAGAYRTRPTLASELPPERESYLVQLGMTWQLGRGLFVDPNVAFRVGGAAADMAFATNVIYSF